MDSNTPLTLQPAATLKPRRVVGALVIGVLLGGLFMAGKDFSGRNASYTCEYDNKGDGRPDETYGYERGLAVKSEQDRNFDGRPDFRRWSEEGTPGTGGIRR
jgi:hypothetical protein